MHNSIDIWVRATSVRSMEVYAACFENMDKFFTMSSPVLSPADFGIDTIAAMRQAHFERLLVGFPYRTYPEVVRLHRAKAILTLAKQVGATDYFADIMAGLDDDIRDERVDTVREVLEAARTFINV